MIRTIYRFIYGRLHRREIARQTSYARISYNGWVRRELLPLSSLPLNVMDYETSLRLMVQLSKLIRRPRVSKDLREEIESGLNLASVTKAYFEDLGYSEPAWYTEMMSGFSPVTKVKSGTAKRDEKEKVVRRSPRRRGPAPVILKSGRIARGR